MSRDQPAGQVVQEESDESRPAREEKSDFGCNQLLWLLLALVAALVFPGRPTIVATEACPEEDAERYLFLEGLCAPSFDARIPPVSAMEPCLNERAELRERCRETLAGFDMNFAQRFFYYGPYWLQLAKRLLTKE